MTDYQKFLERKKIVDVPTGFECDESLLSSKLFEFQRDIVRWQCRRGRSAVFADCGTGKTIMQLSWANQVVHRTGRPVLILAPNEVAKQTVAEGLKFGIETRLVKINSEIANGINVTNYEKLHKYDVSVFGGVVIDESSILKSYDGETRNLIITSFASTAYKGAYTATPAPNDHMELGNHSEFLGVMSRTEMLSTFFVHDGGETSKWRLKRHAQRDFWEWLCSWAVNIKHPSDLGYSDEGFNLPELKMMEHVIDTENKPLDGYLFALPASSLQERRIARRNSTCERVELCAKLIKYDLQQGAEKKVVGGLLQEKRKEMQTEGCGILQASPTKQGEKKNQERLPERILQKKQIPLSQELQKNTETDGEDLRGSAQKIPAGRDISSKMQGRREGVSKEISNQKKKSQPKDEIRNNISGMECNVQKSGKEVCNLRLQKNEYTSKIPIRRSLSQDGKIQGDTLQQLQSCDRSSEGQPSMGDERLSLLGEKWLIWCELNYEQDELEEIFGGMCVSIRGATDENKRIFLEEQWRVGNKPILISKPSIFGFGMNWQHCHNVCFVGLSDSYETFYQAMRRCWRFGQLNSVNIHVIISSLEGAVLANIHRKEQDARKMGDEMVAAMRDISSVEIKGLTRETETYNPQQKIQLPKFI